MIFIARENIEDKLWNQCISESGNSLVYGTTWYLDEIVDSWDAYVWIKNGKYTAVFPIPYRIKFGIRYVYPPFFIQQLGVYSVEERVGELTIDAVSQLQLDYKFIELNMNYASEIGDSRNNFILRLNQPYLDLKKRFSKNHIRNIKKSQKSKLQYLDTVQVKSIVDYFKKDRGSTLSTFTEEDYVRFLGMCAEADKRSCLVVRGLFDGDKMIAGVILINYNGRLTFLFSGVSKVEKNSGGLFNLLNLVIEEFSESDLLLDFEGGSEKGLERFYKGFGGVLESYFFYKKNNLPKILKWIKR